MNRTGTFLLAATIVGGSALALAVPDLRAGMTGPVTVIDGDTIQVGSERVRISGIDAPEMGQQCADKMGRYDCGAAARNALRDMIARDPNVTCQPKDRDRYGRLVAVCANHDGDFGARLVRLGRAVAYRRYSLAYVDQEAAAQAERIGMWEGEFQTPEQYRREHKR